MRITHSDNPLVGWAIWFGTRTATVFFTLAVATFLLL